MKLNVIFSMTIPAFTGLTSLTFYVQTLDLHFETPHFYFIYTYRQNKNVKFIKFGINNVKCKF